MPKTGTAPLTGASDGIGAVHADRLARRGYDLILLARDEARLNAQAACLRAETGSSVDIPAADLAARPDLLRAEHRVSRDRSMTMLVNNAGIALEGFVARGRGTLINVSSVLALAPERFNAVYSGTKSSMLNLRIALQTEPANTCIRVQAALPGATRTGRRGKAGVDVSAMPSGMLMDADDMVDAALSGLDIGETVTIPSLPDMAEWARFNDARPAMGRSLSLAHTAKRYHRAGDAA